jgi:hypothetical protein
MSPQAPSAIRNDPYRHDTNDWCFFGILQKTVVIVNAEIHDYHIFNSKGKIYLN